MADIKNHEAYFATMVRNSYKNEFRSNDNFFNHISSVGSESDIQREFTGGERRKEYDAAFIERQLCESSLENWLLFMENERLHKALSNLPLTDVEFLYELANFHFKKTVFAKTKGISQQAVSKRFHRLRKKILEML